MVIPRPWSAIEKQRSLEQQSTVAKPAATDGRFKAGAFSLFAAWLTIVFSLRHSIQHYLPRNRGAANRLAGFIRYTPNKFLLTVPLSLLMIGYFAACAFDFTISPLKLGGELGFMYGLGWAPVAAIVVVMEIYGYLEPNEDSELIRQRRIRGAEIDAELGYVKKPSWWRLVKEPNQNLSVHERIARNVGEIGGGMATTKNLQSSIEMGNMPVSKRQDSANSTRDSELRTVRMAADLLFPDGPSSPTHNEAPSAERFTDIPVRGRTVSAESAGGGSGLRPGANGRSASSNSSTTLTGVPPQQVRSMLDV